MSNIKPTLAFFGATGGSTAAALALALNAGYTSYALARTPSKLQALLKEQHSVPSATIDTYLTIVEGNVKDVNAVAKTLAPQDKQVATIIMSGIGSYPKMQASIKTPLVALDPTICEDGMNTVVNAVSQLRSQGVYPPLSSSATDGDRAPLIIAISTTGLDGSVRDVPYAYYGLYHWLLKEPHADKRKMESALVTSGNAFVVIRPTLLMDGDAIGLDKVKAGWVRHSEAKYDGLDKEERTKSRPAIGHTIRRRDVGAWAFEKVISTGGADWVDKCVTLTS